MKKNKLVYIILLIVLIIIGFYFLKPKKSEVIETKNNLIVTSVAPLKWVVSEIAGDKFTVEPIVKSNMSHEGYEPDVKDIAKVEDAKLFFYYDVFRFEQVLGDSIKDKNKVTNVLDNINKDLLLKDEHGNDVLVIGEEEDEPAVDMQFKNIKGYPNTNLDFESDEDFEKANIELNEKHYVLNRISKDEIKLKSIDGSIVITLNKNGDLYEASLLNNGKAVKLLQVEEEEPEGEEAEHHHHHDHGSGGFDPHVWFSMDITKVVAKNVLDKLVKTYPSYKDEFNKNYDKFIKNIDEFENYASKQFKVIGSKTFIIYHPALSYFIKNSKLTELPIEIEGKEPSAKGIQQIIEEAKEHNVEYIFIQPQFSKDSTEAIAKELKNVKVVDFNIDTEDVIDNLKYFLNKLEQ